MPASLRGDSKLMWQATIEDIPSGMKYLVFDDGAPLSYQQLIQLLRRDDSFRDWYSELLADSDLAAFYWELPPVTHETYDQAAEFVLINAPELAAVKPNPAPFRMHFDAEPDEDVLVFPNLGGDALLIVPQPLDDDSTYPHFGTFVRRGSPQQIRKLWRCVAETLYQDVTTTPRWLSTAGLGVAWLHIRIDTRPKYYSYVPYTLHP